MTHKHPYCQCTTRPSLFWLPNLSRVAWAHISATLPAMALSSAQLTPHDPQCRQNLFLHDACYDATSGRQQIFA